MQTMHYMLYKITDMLLYHDMDCFSKHIDKIRSFIERKKQSGSVSELSFNQDLTWPEGNNRNIVLAPDMAVELGNPRDTSTSFFLWIDNPDKVRNGRITVVGPELKKCQGKSLPFGKIVLVSGRDFNEDNSYERYREMESLRYDLNLKGYMLRAASQYKREWSRISNEALDKGFSFTVLGSALMKQLYAFEYIEAVEVIFITSSRDDVFEMWSVNEEASRIIGAMNKMMQELSFDCDSCDFTDVCSEVADLRHMRDSMMKKV